MHMNPSGIIMVGAGGHAKVCIELFRAVGETVAFCIADAQNKQQTCLGVPVLVGDEHLQALRSFGYQKLFIGIGANQLRVVLWEKAQRFEYDLVNAISPRAVVSPTAKLGQGIAVMAGAVINADTTIGDLCIINTGATVDHDCCIEAGVHIGPQCGLAGGVKVGRGAFLGIGSHVIPDRVIGSNAVIGSGAAVISDIESDVMAVGVPAKKNME